MGVLEEKDVIRVYIYDERLDSKGDFWIRPTRPPRARGVAGQQAAGGPDCSRACRYLGEVYSAGQGQAIMRKSLWNFRKQEAFLCV